MIMVSIKAILVGLSAVIFLGLTLELVFLFIDIGYSILMKNYPATEPFRQPFYYLFVFVGLFFIMFTGGYLTSIYAEKNTLAHVVFVALLSCGIALYSTSSSYDFTLLSVLFIVISVVFSWYGNVVCRKNSVEAALK